MKPIFEFNDYKSFLTSIFGGARTRTGLRSQFSKSTGCSPSLVSQILGGDRELSLEQAHAATQFLQLNKDESHFFLLLVQKSRAGSFNLKNYFEHQLEEERTKRLSLKNRLDAKDCFSENFQSKYYSSWIYAAVHVSVSASQLSSVDSISKYLNAPASQVSKVIEFLVDAGLVKTRNGQLSLGKKHIHLGNDSENIIKHHSNWRTQALQSLDLEGRHDLHYSSAVTISKVDQEIIKNHLMSCIESTNKIISTSPEEEVYSFNLDFFSLSRKR